jgi:hypothetical protein
MDEDDGTVLGTRLAASPDGRRQVIELEEARRLIKGVREDDGSVWPIVVVSQSRCVPPLVSEFPPKG